VGTSFWQSRLEVQLKAVLGAADPDVLCLQEFWFHDSAQELLRGLAGGLGYELLLCRRSGWEPKDDGLAVLVRSTRFEVVESEGQELCKEGSRVLLKLLLRLKQPGKGVAALPLVLGCTHLTYPHEETTNRLRMVQGFNACRSCYAFAKKHGLDASEVALVLVGDMNAKASVDEDLALQAFSSDGWRSAFAEACGHEAGATHRTHRGEQICADFIMLRGEVSATSAAVLPLAEDSDTPILKARVGGAEGLPAGPPPESLAEWSQLSDHRPLLAALRLEGAAAPEVPERLQGS